MPTVPTCTPPSVASPFNQHSICRNKLCIRNLGLCICICDKKDRTSLGSQTSAFHGKHACTDISITGKALVEHRAASFMPHHRAVVHSDGILPLYHSGLRASSIEGTIDGRDISSRIDTGRTIAMRDGINIPPNHHSAAAIRSQRCTMRPLGGDFQMVALNTSTISRMKPTRRVGCRTYLQILNFDRCILSISDKGVCTFCGRLDKSAVDRE